MMSHRDTSPISRHPLLLVVVLAGLVASLAVGAWWYSLQQDSSTNAEIGMILGFTPASNIWAITPDSGALELLLVDDENGTKLQAIDVINREDGTAFYLLADSPSAVNLYERSEEGVLSKLTNSETIKHSLSYDAVSNTFAFQAKYANEIRSPASIEDWNVVVFNKDSRTEKNVGTGTRSSIMPDGAFVAVQRDTAFLLIDSVSGNEYPLMSIPASPKIVIDGRSESVSIFNPLTMQIDTFAFSRGTLSAAYVRSTEPLAATPDMIGLHKGELFSMRLDAGSQSGTYELLNTATGEMLIATHAAQKGLPQRLLTL